MSQSGGSLATMAFMQPPDVSSHVGELPFCLVTFSIQVLDVEAVSPCLTPQSPESDRGLLWNKDKTFYGKFRQLAAAAARWNDVFIGSLNAGDQCSMAKHVQVTQEQKDHAVLLAFTLPDISSTCLCTSFPLSSYHDRFWGYFKV